MPAHYSKADLINAMRQAGVREGQIVFCHSNIGLFGIPAEGNSRETADRVVLEAFQEVLGPGGTLCVPTFTYSFCKGEEYDPDHTPSTCGLWSERVRTLPGAHRTLDPIFSVAAVGPEAARLTEGVSMECFGPGSFWERFLEADGFICNLNFYVPLTGFHYLEKMAGARYRFDKLFPGTFRLKGQTRKGAAIFFCQDKNNADTQVSLHAFDERLLSTGAATKVEVGRGFLTGISMRALKQALDETLKHEPWFLIEAGRSGKAPDLRTGGTSQAPVLPEEATLREMVEGLWRLPRDIVSDGYDAALATLATQVPMRIHRYPTGTHAWTWLVPEKWTCQEASLETLDGRRLFSYAYNPLHVVSYSLPFDGVVSREELLRHLHVHPFLPDATPFMFKYYERDWGLCCPRSLRDALHDDEYRVRIRTDFSYGELKVGEVLVQGETDDCIVLCAHLCHPGQVADDLSGVVAGIEVMRALRRRQGLRYSYRLLILPETIGSVAWLSQNEHLIPKMRAGLFLEMVSLPNPPALQLSFAGDTAVDAAFSAALASHDAAGWTGPFRTLIGNDERQFNAPGVRVPMLSLSRILPRSHPHWPYPQYHSDADNPENVSWSHLEDTVKLVLKMVDAIESGPALNYGADSLAPVAGAPRNLFKGEVFCSRYGLHIDLAQNPEGHRAFFDILYLIDGRHTAEDMARRCGISTRAVEDVLAELARHGLVDLGVAQ